MDTNEKKTCKEDTDCNKTELCSFDEKDLNHYCIPSSVESMYFGCTNSDFISNESIEKNDEDISYTECLDFTRRQLNKDGFEYNFMGYRPKKKVFVDLTNIIIYLKCGNEILSAIPYKDYFTLECDEKQENCILKSKESLSNFIIQNTKNCLTKGDIHLEIIHECENEGVPKTEKINIYENTSIQHSLSCPVNTNDPLFKIKCDALFFNEMPKSSSISSNIELPDCKTIPIFKIPILVKDVTKYKKKHIMIFKNIIMKFKRKSMT